MRSAVALEEKYLWSFCQWHTCQSILVGGALTANSQFVNPHLVNHSISDSHWGNKEQKLTKYPWLPFHTRHYSCHAMAPHALVHTLGSDFLLPSIPIGSDTGRQQRAPAKLCIWVLGMGSWWPVGYSMSQKWQKNNQDLSNSFVHCELLINCQVSFILNIQRLKCDAIVYEQTSRFLDPG